MALSESIKQWGNSTQEVKISKFKFFHMGFTPSLWTSFQTQKFWWELLRLKINEDKPSMVISIESKTAKTTFCHYSKRLGLWSMILGHNTQWIRGKLLRLHKFWPMLLENLRKIEKTINFSSKSRNFKKCVPGLQLAPNSSGTNFRMFRLILEISTMAFFHICDILEFEIFGSKILFN